MLDGASGRRSWQDGHAAEPGSLLRVSSTITPERYALGQHISVSRRGIAREPIDAARATVGLARSIGVIVSGFPSALTIARGSRHIASVPDRQTSNGRQGLSAFPLPIETPDVVIS